MRVNDVKNVFSDKKGMLKQETKPWLFAAVAIRSEYEVAWVSSNLLLANVSVLFSKIAWIFFLLVWRMCYTHQQWLLSLVKLIVICRCSSSTLISEFWFWSADYACHFLQNFYWERTYHPDDPEHKRLNQLVTAVGQNCFSHRHYFLLFYFPKLMVCDTHTTALNGEVCHFYIYCCS